MTTQISPRLSAHLKPAIVLALLVFESLPAAVAAQPAPLLAEAAGTRLEFQARGAVRMAPDRSIISAGVVTQAEDASGALRANAQRMNAVIAALRAAGIADKDVQTQSVTLAPQYRYPPNEMPVAAGYQARNILSVALQDVGRAGAIIDALVKQGANEVSGPSFTISDRSAAEDQARQEALRQVKARAALYAKALGLSVRRTVSLNETVDGGSPLMPFVSARAMSADAGLPKTSLSGGEQEVAVTLTAVVELAPAP